MGDPQFKWCQPGDVRERVWIVTFEDQERRKAVFDNEAEAREFWEKANTTKDQLFDEMDRAYTAQAYVVDNGGSDDASYRAERRCYHVETEIKYRKLEDVYGNYADTN